MEKYFKRSPNYFLCASLCTSYRGRRFWKMNVTNSCNSTLHSSIYENVNFFRPRIITISCLGLLLAVLATLENAFIMVTIFRTSNLQKPSYFLIVSMALVDVLISAGFVPMVIVQMIFALQKNKETVCRMGEAAELLAILLYGMSFVMSFLISVDRYLAISLKQRYRSTVTKKKVLCAIFLAWFVTLLFSLICRYTKVFRYDRLVYGVAGILFLSCTAGLYVKCFISLHHLNTSRVHSQQGVNSNSLQNSFNATKYKKSLNTMIIILASLLVCCIPFLCAQYFIYIRSTENSVMFLFLATLLFCLNSLTNPLIYIIRFKDLRNACRETLRTLIGR